MITTGKYVIMYGECRTLSLAVMAMGGGGNKNEI